MAKYVRKHHGGRAMLNKAGHYSTAAIVAEIEDTGGWPKGMVPEERDFTRWNIQPQTILQIANCDRSIAFEIDMDDDGNSLAKLDTLIEILTAFRKGFKIEMKRYEKRAAELGEDSDDDDE